MKFINQIKHYLSWFVEVWKRYSDGENVLVYQMGKVGSTALENSVPNSIHTHMMYGNSPCSVHLSQRRHGLVKKILGYAGDLIKRLAVKSRSEIKIITLVRDPYQRDVSMFFQDLPHWLYAYVGLGNHDTRSAGLDFLYSAFESAYDYQYALDWFDREFKRFTGIDVYSEPFDCESGFSIINKGKFTVLVMRLENIASLGGVVSDFVGSNVEVKNDNAAEKKWYADVYRAFKDNYKPSRSYLEEVYGSKLVNHFYTDDEIARAMRRASGEKG